jgi:hypothetical protein
MVEAFRLLSHDMTIGQEFLKEVEAELKASRRRVERVPSEKGKWKPHPKSSDVPIPQLYGPTADEK